MYIKDEALKLAAAEYDRIEGKMMEHFRALRKLLDKEHV